MFVIEERPPRPFSSTETPTSPPSSAARTPPPAAIPEHRAVAVDVDDAAATAGLGRNYSEKSEAHTTLSGIDTDVSEISGLTAMNSAVERRTGGGTTSIKPKSFRKLLDLESGRGGYRASYFTSISRRIFPLDAMGGQMAIPQARMMSPDVPAIVRKIYPAVYFALASLFVASLSTPWFYVHGDGSVRPYGFFGHLTRMWDPSPSRGGRSAAAVLCLTSLVIPCVRLWMLFPYGNVNLQGVTRNVARRAQITEAAAETGGLSMLGFFCVAVAAVVSKEMLTDFVVVAPGVGAVCFYLYHVGTQLLLCLHGIYIDKFLAKRLSQNNKNSILGGSLHRHGLPRGSLHSRSSPSGSLPSRNSLRSASLRSRTQASAIDGTEIDLLEQHRLRTFTLAAGLLVSTAFLGFGVGLDSFFIADTWRAVPPQQFSVIELGLSMMTAVPAGASVALAYFIAMSAPFLVHATLLLLLTVPMQRDGAFSRAFIFGRCLHTLGSSVTAVLAIALSFSAFGFLYDDGKYRSPSPSVDWIGTGAWALFVGTILNILIVPFCFHGVKNFLLHN